MRVGSYSLFIGYPIYKLYIQGYKKIGPITDIFIQRQLEIISDPKNCIDPSTLFCHIKTFARYLLARVVLSWCRINMIVVLY